MQKTLKMSNLMFASSPSWYCTGAIDTDSRGFLYFGANYNLYVLNIGVSPPRYLLHLYAHQQRAVGVSVCKHPGLWLCSTIGEDGKVKIWDLEAKICLQEHSVHKTALTCVHWSPVDKNLIVSADNKGGIVIWKTNTSEFKHICPEAGHIFAIKCSPYAGNIIAVGYRSSTILILNVERNGQVTQRLRGHDEEIQGLCWCPRPGEQLDTLAQGGDAADLESSTQGPGLLASSSKDRTIRVWAVSTGRALTTLRLQSSGKKEKIDDRVGGRIWVALHWPEHRPTQLVSSSFNGEVILWDLVKGERRSFSASKHSRGHNRLVFNAAVGGVNGEVLCTSSMDRQIVLWDMDTLKAKCSIPTLGGFGYCVSSSPVNPGRLAVGSGDHLIRIWNTDNLVNPFDTQTYWQGLKSKVTTLMWHPVKEGQLAYGTEDGRVGIYDIFSSRPPQISSTYHKGTVYTVCWGPPCVDHDSYPPNTHFLYSCGDGRLLQHEPDKLDREAKAVHRTMREVNGIQGKTPNPSEVCFKPDYTVVAVGNDDGSLDILSVPSLKRLCCVQSHRKLVNVIRWHPEYTAESRLPSKYRHWLASGSGEYQVHVLDLGHVIENKLDKTPVITEPTCQLIGHTHRITQLSWSPFHDNKLASASYDHTVQIWDVSSCEALANYRGHFGRLMCVQWSDLDPDVVYSGGQDNTVQCWKISEQEFTHPPVCVIERKKKNKKKFLRDDAGGGSMPESTAAPSVNAELQALIEEKRQQLSRNIQSPTASDGNVETDKNRSPLNHTPSVPIETERAEHQGGQTTGSDIPPVQLEGRVSVALSVADILGESLTIKDRGSSQAMDSGTQQSDVTVPVTVMRRDGKERKKKRVKSLFPTSSLRDNRGKSFQHQDCVQLANILYKDEQPSTLGEEWFHIGHFIDRKSTFELVRFEESHHRKSDNNEQAYLLEMFKGNLSAVVHQAASAGHLSDWLVGLCGLSSSTLHRDTGHKYADQLAQDGLIHKATSYLLAARKVNEAIDLLAKHGAFKDAVCLARLRLAPNDPKLKSIYLNWAHHMFRDANLEMAAKCYLAVADPLQAAVALSRRSDLSALQAAAQICIVANQMEAASLYTRRLVQDCYMACDWLSAQEVVMSHPEFMHYGMPLTCHELLVTQFCEMHILPAEVLQAARESTETDIETPKIPKFLVSSSEVSLCPWPTKLVAGEAFCNAVVRKWVETCGLPLIEEKLSDVYKTLRESKAERHGALQWKQILADVSLDISLGILQLLLGDGDRAAEHWAVAIATCIEQREQNVAEGLCRLLLPQGIERYEKQAHEIHALFVTSSNTLAAANRKTSLTLCKNLFSSHQVEHGDKLPTIHCESQDFTSLACLKAYYCICVLMYWKKDLHLKTQDTLKSPRNGQLSGSAESLSSPNSRKSNRSPRYSPVVQRLQEGTDNTKKIIGKDLTSEFSQGKVHVEGIQAPSMEKPLNLSMQDLLEVAKSLIWDIQVDKQKVQQSLIQMQNTVTRMISSHREVKSSTNHQQSSEFTNEAITEGSVDKTSAVKSSLKRYPSGEYLPMNKKPQDAKPKRKPHEDILLTLGKEERGFGGAPVLSMIRGTVVEEVEEDIRKVDADTDDVDHRVPGLCDDDKSIMNTKEEEHLKAFDKVVEGNNHIVSDYQDLKEKRETTADDDIKTSFGNRTDQEKESDNVLIGGDLNDPNGQDIVSLEVKNTEAVMNDAYSNLPDDWFELPIDVKYNVDYMTVQLLTCEQKKLEEQLLQFSPQVLRLPFPAVFDSVFILSQLLCEQNGPEYISITEALREWTKQHQYLTDHQKLLDTLKPL